ncbi:hypothetical protein CEXT_292921 [Caerostris extrusa]|uniref:Uncharacterized protein n=1 Tax=Caerostris extrusa TaxID=172846 RepID=A0AAV4Y3F9_CAEEX|nr:hypothetical protein CEXT_292921 [Caerostris extrusa]
MNSENKACSLKLTNYESEALRCLLVKLLGRKLCVWTIGTVLKGPLLPIACLVSNAEVKGDLEGVFLKHCLGLKLES